MSLSFFLASVLVASVLVASDLVESVLVESASVEPVFSPFSAAAFFFSASLPAFVPASAGFRSAPPGTQPASASSARASLVSWSPSASLLSA